MDIQDLLTIGALIEMQSDYYRPKTIEDVQGEYGVGMFIMIICGVGALIGLLTVLSKNDAIQETVGFIVVVLAGIALMVMPGQKQKQIDLIREQQRQDYVKAQKYYAWLREDFKNALREVRDEDRGPMIEDWLQCNETMLTPETLVKIRRIAEARN